MSGMLRRHGGRFVLTRLRSIVMILTKDHTPTSLALGTTNSLSELFQMAGIAIGAPFIRYSVPCPAERVMRSSSLISARCLRSRSREECLEAICGRLLSVFSHSSATSARHGWQNIDLLRTLAVEIWRLEWICIWYYQCMI